MSKKNRKLKIGIVGCGAIGSSLAKEILVNFSDSAELVALYDINPEKSSQLARKLKKKNNLASLQELIKRSDLVIESSSAKAAWEIVRQALSGGSEVMAMSIGGLIGHAEQLLKLSLKNNVRVYLPSGAIAGIDALKAANLSRIKKVILTTRKNPKAFCGVAYVENKFKLHNLKKDKVLFFGRARQAIKYFPQNINVAAILGLAAVGVDKTQVKIVACPGVKKNIHEVLIESEAANIFTRTENVLHPQNPKTSYLAVLSAVATLKQILWPIKVGA